MTMPHKDTSAAKKKKKKVRRGQQSKKVQQQHPVFSTRNKLIPDDIDIDDEVAYKAFLESELKNPKLAFTEEGVNLSLRLV